MTRERLKGIVYRYVYRTAVNFLRIRAHKKLRMVLRWWYHVSGIEWRPKYYKWSFLLRQVTDRNKDSWKKLFKHSKEKSKRLRWKQGNPGIWEREGLVMGSWKIIWYQHGTSSLKRIKESRRKKRVSIFLYLSSSPCGISIFESRSCWRNAR